MEEEREKEEEDGEEVREKEVVVELVSDGGEGASRWREGRKRGKERKAAIVGREPGKGRN